MFRNNKELRRGLMLLLAATLLLTGVGATQSAVTGALVLATGGIVGGIYLATEYYRYRRLRKLSDDLDHLLIRGIPLPIEAYEEGELSILATQIQKMTRMLRESAEAMKADKIYLADSLADISHQLRTPLTAMNLTTTLLRDPQLSPQRRMELTGELRGLLSRTEWFVETLLKMSKLDAGTVRLQEERVSVRALIDRAVEPVAIPMDLRNQTLEIHCAGETFTGDLIWTGEALSNVLKNCMEHTPEGGTIRITATETALYTEIQVTDTGPGLDPRDIPHLFERFYKGSNAAATSYGIGLAFARSIIAAQNGTIQASNTATGARFRMKFYKQVI